MNAARFARRLIDGGVDPKLAQTLAECLADEIERTVATNDHVEAVVTREVQQLRVEMREEFRRADERMAARLDAFQAQSTERLDAFQAESTRRLDASQAQMTERFDAFQAQITQRLDGHFRWLVTSLMVLFLAMLGNILKDVLA